RVVIHGPQPYGGGPFAGACGARARWSGDAEEYVWKMVLEAITSPADLRRLNGDQLDALAAEIREFIVQAVSQNAGHLGSNLGAVELTLAMHRAFNSPRDIILWDTGHQAY